jgi:simple sugar transport system ATP-binding protein
VLEYDSGILTINGKQIEKYNAIAAAQQGIGIIYQDLSLFPNLTVLENIYISQMLNDKKAFVFSGRFKNKAQQIVQQLGITLI